MVIGFGSEKKWYSIKEDSPQGIWDKSAERMLLEFAKSGCPFSVLLLHCPEVNSKAKEWSQKQRSGKLSLLFVVDQETIKTIFELFLQVS